MDMTHPFYGNAIVTSDTEHRRTLPANILSIVENDLRTESLVKISWESKARRDSISFIGGLVIQEYSTDDHHLAVALLNTSPDWSNTRRPEGNQ